MSTPNLVHRLDRSVLEAIAKRFKGGPVGLTTLAASVGEEAETIESVVEPYLVREGLLARTPRGRMLTSEGLRHTRESTVRLINSMAYDR